MAGTERGRNAAQGTERAVGSLAGEHQVLPAGGPAAGGEAIHATRAEYSARHIERLDLIQALRQIVGLNIGQIRGLVKMADDGVPRLALLAAVQRVVLNLENYTTATAGTPQRRLTPSYVFAVGRIPQ